MAKGRAWDHKVELENSVSELLRASGADQVKNCLQQLYTTAPDESAACAALAVQVGPKAWQESYEEAVPQGYLCLSAALELADRLPRHRDALLAKAVLQLQAEGLSEPVDLRNWDYSGELSDAATTEELDRLVAQGDLPAFHGRLVPFIYGQARRLHGMRYVYSRAALDLGAGAQRLLIMDAALRLLDRLEYRQAEAVLYPASQYFVHKQPDYRAASILQDYLTKHGEIEGDNHDRAPELDPDAHRELVDAVMKAEPQTLLDRMVGLWKDKASLKALGDAVQVAALRLLRTAPPEDWVLPVRGYLFADAVANSTAWLRGGQALGSVIMAALIVRSAADAFQATRSLEAPAPAADADQERLYAALEAGDLEQALCQTAGLANRDQKALAESLVAAALCDHPSQRTGHDLLFAAAVLAGAERAGAERSLEHYLGLADYLTR